MKICTGCQQARPLSDFTRDAKTKDGLAQKCRACSKALHVRWLAENPDKPAQSARRYYAENKEECRRKARERAEKKRRADGKRTKDEVVAAQKAEAAQRRALPAPPSKTCCVCKTEKPVEEFNKSRATCDGRVVQCRACASDRKATWVQSRAEWVAAYDKNYRVTNKDVVETNARRRRARELNAPGADHTVEEVRELWRRSGGVCANVFCGEPIASGHRHLDHIMPLARGGSNAIENLQFLCPSCNRKKHATLPDEWRQKAERRFFASLL